MKPHLFFLFSCLIFTQCSLIFSAEDSKSELVRFQPTAHEQALRNPGMGWVFHHYDNSIRGYGEPFGQGYDGKEFPGMSVVYLRLAWSHLEPEPGKFNWSILDSVIQRYARAGSRFALRLTVFEGVTDQGPPNWLREQGCPGFMVKPYDIECWEPDYSDEFFLKKLENFLLEAGKRYDGHPDLEFVDVGTLGIWGEGNPIHKKYSLDVLKKHIDLHRKAFPNALLVANDDWASTFRNPDDPKSRDIPYFQDDPSITQFVYDAGLTLRDDSLNVYPDPKLHYSDYRAERFWRTRPVILEKGHYSYAKRVGAWGGERYLQAVKDYHGSYTSIHANPIEFLKENQELIDKINLCLGYRFHLVEVEFPEKVKKEKPLRIRANWTNVGVAPCYAGGHPVWTLIDSEGNIGAVLADESFNVKELFPKEGQEKAKEKESAREFLLSPMLHPGKYTLYVSIGDLTGRPLIALPYSPLSDEKSSLDHLRYPVGTMSIE